MCLETEDRSVAVELEDRGVDTMVRSHLFGRGSAPFSMLRFMRSIGQLLGALSAGHLFDPFNDDDAKLVAQSGALFAKSGDNVCYQLDFLTSAPQVPEKIVRCFPGAERVG